MHEGLTRPEHRPMTFLRSLPISRKLYFSFGLVVALLITVVALSIRGFGTLSSAAHSITDISTPKYNTAAEIKFDVATSLAWETTYLLDHGASRAGFVKSTDVVRTELTKLNSLSTDDQDRASIAVVSAKFDNWLRADSLEWAAVQRHDYKAAVNLGWGQSVPAYNKLKAAIIGYESQAHQEVTGKIATFDSTRSSTQLLSLIVGGIAVLLAAGLAFLIARTIRRPLVKMQRAAETAASGDLTVDVDVDSKDEIGAMAAAVQTMIENIRDIVGRLSTTAGTIAGASQQMASTSQETGRAVDEIARAVGDVAAGAERQVHIVGEARDMTEEVVEAARSGAEGAKQTASAADQARALSEEGMAAVERATTAMQSVNESSAAVTEAMRALGSKSEQIGGIVETITGIAGQTNLLALNAAIEAARAGEQGRGFAVVAEEVRKLAEESQQAAASIAQLIGEIQSETQGTLETVEDGAKLAEQGVEVVDEARTAFVQIGDAVGDVNARIQEIAGSIDAILTASERMSTNMGEVASVAEQSSASTEQVSASTQQTSASTQEIAASAESLARTAEELDRLVNEFKLAQSA
ncbi:MAG: methyl-accepting chemotaxis protein [Actinobacteria bacterium]|nr:methyl-accepting chemotaxis protein [Actinomycetota bacterium]